MNSIHKIGQAITMGLTVIRMHIERGIQYFLRQTGKEATYWKPRCKDVKVILNGT